MKRTLACLLFWLLVCGCASKAKLNALVGVEAPGTRLYMLDGQVVSLDQFKGKHTVLLFWATSCSLSKNVLQDIAAFARRKGSEENIEVIAVSIDKLGDQAGLMELIDSLREENLKHAFSGNDIYDEAYMAFGISSMPTIVILDPSGRVAASGEGESVLKDYFLPQNRYSN